MSPARRSLKRREWPRGLYEPRPGYYVWKHPATGKTFALGTIPLAQAKHQALEANAHVMATGPSLVDRLTGATHTVADLLLEMPTSEVYNTAKTQRSQDKAIRAALGGKTCAGLSVKDCAEFIEGVAKAGKARSAQALRSRLMSVCQRGQQLGWMTTNPAEVTRQPAVEVKRGRLTLEAFQAIYAEADRVSEWLGRAMRLAVVTGADRSTICGMTRAMVGNGLLTFQREKTAAWVAVPLSLRLEALGLTLADVVEERTGVLSKHLIHHVRPWGNAPVGSPIHPNAVTRAFTEARKLAKIPDAAAPTFHEIRSLCKRLYTDQGGVDTKALLGHATERMSDLYADPRGVEPVKVRIGK